jgi:putative PIN family toxin of toxin-antitoxin system
MRVVLDTNVLVSALITEGRTAKLLRALLERKVELLLSKAMLDEFVGVISRPKFREYAGNEEIKHFLRLILSVALIVDVNSKFDATPDVADNVVLAVAHDGKANYIVSGDRHLLTLKKFKGIRIVNASQMLTRLRAT